MHLMSCCQKNTKLLKALFLSILFLSINVFSQEEQPKIALLIGNDNYTSLPQLRNATSDVQNISKILRDYGFETITVENVNRTDFIKAVNDFRNFLIENNNAIALFYYAGHAVQVDGKNFLIPLKSSIRN